MENKATLEFDHSASEKVRIEVNIQNVDNEMTVVVNGIMVYFNQMHNDPTLSDKVEITTWLKKGVNKIVFTGINWGAGNPWHFQYDISANGKVIYKRNQISPSAAGAQGGVVWMDTCTFTIK